MSKHKFGFLSPQPYMKKAIEEIKDLSDIEVLEPKSWNDVDIDSIVAECKAKGIEAVAGFAQKDAYSHILINNKLGLPAPSKLSFLYCMNKYNMRQLEKHPSYFDWVDPLTESDEQIIAKIKEWPFMLKNTSLSLGRGVFKIEDEKGLKEILADYRSDKKLQKEIADNFVHFTAGIPKDKLPSKMPPFIAEHYVDINKSIEYCYEGFVDANGKLHHYALTEEVYFKNHQALGYITPTMTVGTEVAKKVGDWAEEYMSGLIELGFVNQFFNIEFWINEDGSIALTEINPRAAHSYYYNYKICYGNNLFNDNLRLAATLPVEDKTPWDKWVDGDKGKSTLIVLITGKEKGVAGDILDYDYIEDMHKKGEIDVARYTKARDAVLTDGDMTSAGAMMMQLWVSGTQEEVIAKEIEIRKRVYKKPQTTEYPPHWK